MHGEHEDAKVDAVSRCFMAGEEENKGVADDFIRREFVSVEIVGMAFAVGWFR